MRNDARRVAVIAHRRPRCDTEQVLYSFNGVNLIPPFTPLTIDASGNLYGASVIATTSKYGAIFKLTKGTDGRWATTTLYEFRGAADGRGPKGNLIFDAAGNLYGTTLYTGKTEYCCGTVFELTPTASGPWKENTLYSFKGGDDGGVPNGSGLVFDNAGNLYGTTSEYGQGGYGTVFELSPTATGGWTETVLYSFQGGSDGAAPESGLIFDKVGNLYAETPAGGGKTNGSCIYGGCGTIFELTWDLADGQRNCSIRLAVGPTAADPPEASTWTPVEISTGPPVLAPTRPALRGAGQCSNCLRDLEAAGTKTSSTRLRRQRWPRSTDRASRRQDGQSLRRHVRGRCVQHGHDLQNHPVRLSAALTLIRTNKTAPITRGRQSLSRCSLSISRSSRRWRRELAIDH